jgi:hypothetical protein
LTKRPESSILAFRFGILSLPKGNSMTNESTSQQAALTPDQEERIKRFIEICNGLNQTAERDERAQKVVIRNAKGRVIASRPYSDFLTSLPPAS